MAVDGDDTGLPAVVWFVERGPQDDLDASKLDSLDTAEDVRGQLGGAQNEVIVAMDFFEEDLAFVHPDWESGSFDDRGSGTGDRVEGESRIDGDFLQKYASDSTDD